MTDEPLPPDGDRPPEEPTEPNKPPDGEQPAGKPPKRPDARPLRRTRHKATRSKLQRESDLAAISRLYLESKSYEEIAEATGMTVRTVYSDIVEITKRWRDSGLPNFHEAKLEELRRIARLENEAWKAFFKSQKIKKTTTRQLTGSDSPFGDDAPSGKRGKNSSRKMAQITEIDGPGDPRFMVIIRQCGKDRAELLGLNAPQDEPKSQPDSITTLVASLEDLPTEALEAIQSARTKFIAHEKAAPK